MASPRTSIIPARAPLMGLNRLQYPAAAACLLGILLGDLFGFGRPVMGALGFFSWMLSYLLLFWHWLRCLRVLRCELARFRPFASILVLYLLAVYMSLMTVSGTVSYESLFEVECALRRLDAPGFGYHSPCYMGYPTRQYFLMALPTLIGGRSGVMVQAGGALYLLLGLVIFAAGAIVNLGRSRRADLLTALMLTLPLHSRWLNIYGPTLEQGIFPLCLGLMLLGLLLHWQRTAEPHLLLLIGLLLYYLVHSYTPSMALYVGAIGVVAYMARERRQLWLALPPILGSLLSFQFKRSYDNLELGWKPGSLSPDDFAAALDIFVRQLLFQDQVRPQWSWELQVIFLGAVGPALLGLLGWKRALAAAWIVAAIAACVFTKGFLTGDPARQLYSLHGMYRSTFVLPVLAWLLLGPLRLGIGQSRGARMGAAVALLAMLLSGVRHLHATMPAPKPSPQAVLIESISRKLPRHTKYAIGIEEPLYSQLQHWEKWAYFVPQARELGPLEDCSQRYRPWIGEELLIVRPGGACLQALIGSGRMARMRIIVDLADVQVYYSTR